MFFTKKKLFFLCVIFLLIEFRECSSNNETSSEDTGEEGDYDEGSPDDTSEAPATSRITPEKLLEKAIGSTMDEIKPLLKKSKKKVLEEDDSDDLADDRNESHTSHDVRRVTKDANETISILENLSKMTASGMDALFREALPLVTSIGYDANISSSCLASFLKLFTGVRKQEIWAFKMLDSFGRVDSGTFDGTVTNFGEYDQCLGINFPGDFDILEDITPSSSADTEEIVPEERVVGKYCVMRVDIPMPPKPKRLHLHDPVIKLNGTSLDNTILHYLSKTFDTLYSINGFRYGICIPSSCSALEIENLVNKVAFPVLKIPFLIGPDKYCDTKNDHFVFNDKQKLSIGILVFFTLIAIAASLLDLIRIIINSCNGSKGQPQEKEKIKAVPSLTPSSDASLPSLDSSASGSRTSCASSSSSENNNPTNSSKKQGGRVMESKVFKIIFSFSILENTRKLFHLRKDQVEESTLSAVHGMRILSMIWIIIGHTYCFGGFYKLLYTFRRVSVAGIENPARWEYQALINTFLLVDTFFFLGGVVLIFVALPMLHKHKGKFNYFIYAIHRWVRLTPAMIGVICFITIMPALGTGPYWKQEMTWQSEGCQKNWWMNLLYINNWVYPVDEMCGGMTWFIAADFQIYLFVAPLIFFAYYKSSICGLIVNFILLIVGMASSGISTYIHDTAPTFGIQHVIDLNLLHEYAEFGYFPTYHHIAPYCLGTFIGYLILRHQKTPFLISKWTQSILWVLAPASSLFVLFVTKDWNTFDLKITPSLTVSILYSVFQRILWSFGIAWVSFACATGYGGIVNDILSFKLFIPFSRLSYSIYMVHLIPIFLRVNSMRYTRAWDDFEFVSWGVFNILLGIFGAYLLYVIFESPINSLEKLLFRAEVEKSDKSVIKMTEAVVTGDETICRTRTNNGEIEEQHPVRRHRPSDMCPKHAIETLQSQHHPITTFAAYKLRTSSMSSGFSDVSGYSCEQHIHQHHNHIYPHEKRREVSKRQRM